MNPLLGIFITLGSLVFAGAFPFLIRQERVRETLRSLVPQRFQPKETGGFAAISPDEARDKQPEDMLQRCVLEAVAFVAFVGGCLWFLGDSHGAAGQLSTPTAAFLGIAGGIMLRKWWGAEERLSETRRCTERMRATGIEGSWQGDADEPIPFRRQLLSAIGGSTGCEVIAPSGLSILSLLSHPARPNLEAPHPALAGKKLRILVLPPRSQKVDPLRQRRSCAEEALSRAGSTPEKHWRRLQQALEIQRRWNTEYDCQVQVKFLEGRPIHAMLMAGPRGWFRPWFGSGEHWFEVASRGGGTDLRTSLDDHFEGAWQDAAEELSVFLRKDGSAAVMTTGSTAVRKPVNSG